MIKRISTSRYYSILDKIIMISCFVVSLWFIFVLIYRQATAVQGWESDIGSYINMVIDGEYGSYPILFWISSILYKSLGNPQLATAIVVIFFYTLTFIVTRKIISVQTQTGILATIGTVVLFFSSMIFNHRLEKFGILHYFEGVGSQNPWHNATYICARPFVILSFVYGAYTLLHYEDDLKRTLSFRWETHKWYIIFALSLFLSTLAKPSYTLPHMVVVFIVAVFRFLKTKGKNFWQSLMLALTYIPTIIVLIYQYFYTLTGTDSYGNEQGMGIKLGGSWTLYSDNIPLSIILASFFPLIVLIIHKNLLNKSQQFRFAWQIYLAGLIMRLVLIEQGYRAAHDNFCWGYYYGILLVFFSCIEEWIKDCIIILEDNKVSKKHIILTIVESVTLLIHFIFGIHFFQLLYWGNDYRMPWV